MAFSLRDATPKDAAAIAAIYRPYAEESVATFEEIAPGQTEIASRMAATLAAGFPYLVAEEGGAVAGYAYAGLYKARSAYRYTVENSVYVAADHARQGIGTALMREVIARCTASGYRQMMAVISGAPDSASVRMHAALGFRPAAHLPSLGLKFGRWIDVIEMQLALGEGDSTVPR
jgi:phosphinothricin acetyltransferase